MKGRAAGVALSLLSSFTSATVVRRQDLTDVVDLPTVPSPPTLPRSSSTSTTTTSPSSTATSFSGGANNLPATPVNATTDTDGCFKPDRFAARQNIFCTPTPGQQWGYDAAYDVHWDITYEPPQDSLIIEVFATSYFIENNDTYPARASHALYSTRNTSSGRGGHSLIRTDRKWLEDGKATNLTIVLRTYTEDNNADEDFERPIVRTGPTIVLLNKKGPNVGGGGGGGGGGGSNKLGQSVGIPIGLLAVLAIVGTAIFFVLRRRKRNRGDYNIKRRQSGASKGGGLVGPFQGMRRPHKREPSFSFQDESVKGGGVWAGGAKGGGDGGGGAAGVELQERQGWNRGQGHKRESSDWGWGGGGGALGSGMGSPKGDEEGAGGNVFREEMGRQQGARGW